MCLINMVEILVWHADKYKWGMTVFVLRYECIGDEPRLGGQGKADGLRDEFAQAEAVGHEQRNDGCGGETRTQAAGDAGCFREVTHAVGAAIR